MRSDLWSFPSKPYLWGEKRNLTSGGGRYLMTYKVNGIHFCWNFDDLEEVNFAINVYGDMLMGGCVSMIGINHINTKPFRETTDFLFKSQDRF